MQLGPTLPSCRQRVIPFAHYSSNARVDAFMEYCESAPEVRVSCIWPHIAATDKHQSLGVCDETGAFAGVESLIGI